MKVKLLAVFFGALALTACSKLTKENYDKLEMGMSQKEVESIIGNADNCGKTLGTLACTWGNEDAKHIKIVFMGNKAVTFNYDGLE
ncbi:DUF3862 domain-containing protein [Alteromonas sp. 345S023]|jgi:hypothetical protein|uniref:DUF3862 domain-containing protein n=1 Tax=Alteromonas profundi TaxID=2696062 RepID=A0A7X5LIC6_9ALTE|nr:DUF3862 domain-containing protein [Alteromonas profundi]NDV89917.1 DUF3862 domain-containing protein [Alteromonas profundi]